jgi:hypothetical protein
VELAFRSRSLFPASRSPPRTTAQSDTCGANSFRRNENGGSVGVGSLGYGFGIGLRLKVEGDFRRDAFAI